MNKIIKKLFLILLFSFVSLSINGMEENAIITQNKPSTSKNVPSLINLCIESLAQTISRNPENGLYVNCLDENLKNRLVKKIAQKEKIENLLHQSTKSIHKLKDSCDSICVFNSTGTKLAVGNGTTLNMYEISKKNEERLISQELFNPNQNEITAIAFNNQDTWLAIGTSPKRKPFSHVSTGERTVFLYKIEPNKLVLIQKTQSSGYPIETIVFHPKDTLVATGSPHTKYNFYMRDHIYKIEENGTKITSLYNRLEKTCEASTLFSLSGRFFVIANTKYVEIYTIGDNKTIEYDKRLSFRLSPQGEDEKPVAIKALSNNITSDDLLLITTYHGSNNIQENIPITKIYMYNIDQNKFLSQTQIKEIFFSGGIASITPTPQKEEFIINQNLGALLRCSTNQDHLERKIIGKDIFNNPLTKKHSLLGDNVWTFKTSIFNNNGIFLGIGKQMFFNNPFLYLHRNLQPTTPSSLQQFSAFLIFLKHPEKLDFSTMLLAEQFCNDNKLEMKSLRPITPAQWKNAQKRDVHNFFPLSYAIFLLTKNKENEPNKENETLD